MDPLSTHETHGNQELASSLNEVLNRLALPFVPGRVFFVIPTADPAYIEFNKRFQKKFSDGQQAVHNSIATAYAQMTSNRQDVMILGGQTTHTLTEMLDITKSRISIVGMDEGRRYGQKTKIQFAGTTGATNIATIKNTGVRNFFKGFKVINGSVIDESLYAFAEGGEYTKMEDVEIYKSTDLDQAGAAELLMNGDSFQGKRLTIGSLADAVTANGARPNILLNRETITGKVARDVTIEDSLLWRKSSDADNRFVYGSGATDVERQFLMKNCLMVLAKLSTTTMALAVHVAAALTEGHIILDDTNVAGDVTSVATQTGILVKDYNVAAGKAGLMLQAIAQ